MVTIRITDYSTDCYTNDDGDRVYPHILEALQSGERVTVSFEGVTTTNSSFLNTALVPLLDIFSFDELKKRLTFTNTNKFLNFIIKDRFEKEAQGAATKKE